jgi:hypothetical protein
MCAYLCEKQIQYTMKHFVLLLLVATMTILISPFYAKAQDIPDGEPATQAEALEAALEAGYDHPEDMMTTYEIVYSGPYRDYHMNWGWNGDENGYYASTQAVLHDGVWYSFVTDQEILYNIRSIAK